MKRFKRLPGEPNIFRIPKRGAPPEECPLNGGKEVPFLDCLECEYFIDFDTHRFSHCGIKEEEEARRYEKEIDEKRREQEEFDRKIAERNAIWEGKERKIREEMAAMRAKMERDRKKWMKEFRKQEEEDEKKEQEWEETIRKFIADTYGEHEVEWVEGVLEDMKNDRHWREDDEEEDEEEEREDEY